MPEKPTRPAGLAVSVVALIAGLAIGYIDSRPRWDDTGITVGLLVIAGGASAFARPRAWWLSGLLVGLPLPVFNFAMHGSWQSAPAALIAIVAAGIGGVAGRTMRPTESSHNSR